MGLSVAATWNRHPIAEDERPGVEFGPGAEAEGDLRLIGNVADKRVLELGCGNGRASVAFALQGARAIALDPSPEQLAAARRLSEREGVKVELHEGTPADLAFVRAESIDVVFSALALNLVDDVNRVFRQVHRVLRQGSPFVFSVVHPANALLDDGVDSPATLRRTYFDRSPIDFGTDRPPFTGHVHTVSDLFAGLGRANFRVDLLLEPEPRLASLPPGVRPLRPAWFPPILIMRARKEGL